MNYNQIEESIRCWAADQEGVRALVVIGSRARTDHTADAWSDLDLILFVTDPDVFAADDAWLDHFGPAALSYLQITGNGYPEWIVLYDGGLKIDFLLAPDDYPLAEVFSKSPFDVLYGWMAEETAVQQHHPYPASTLDQVHDWIEAALKEID